MKFFRTTSKSQVFENLTKKVLIHFFVSDVSLCLVSRFRLFTKCRQEKKALFEVIDSAASLIIHFTNGSLNIKTLIIISLNGQQTRLLYKIYWVLNTQWWGCRKHARIL